MNEQKNKTYKFIVVEDTKSHAELLESVLKNAFPGSEVEIFDNGKDAITRIQKNHFDMVLTDLHLDLTNEYNGWSVMESVYYSGKPVLIVSSASLLERVQLWTKYAKFNKNRVRFLAKPVTVKTILDNVSKIINNNEGEISILKRITKKLKGL